MDYLAPSLIRIITQFSTCIPTRKVIISFSKLFRVTAYVTNSSSSAAYTCSDAPCGDIAIHCSGLRATYLTPLRSINLTNFLNVPVFLLFCSGLLAYLSRITATILDTPFHESDHLLNVPVFLLFCSGLHAYLSRVTATYT